MAHYRALYRNAVRDALAASPGFADFKVISAWVQSIDAADLPAIGVATPGERKDRDSLDTSARDTTLIVVVKRSGGEDIEDLLDDDSFALEQLLLPVLRAQSGGCDLEQTATKIDGSGAQRVGTLTLQFRLNAFLAEPITL